MKTTITTSIVCMAWIAIYLFSPGVQAQTCFATFTNEEPIDVKIHLLPPRAATTSISNFTLAVAEHNTNHTFSVVAAKIAKQAFCTLKMEAMSVQQNTATVFCSGGGTCQKYVTGVKIIYGLDTLANKIQLYYQPMVLCYMRDTTFIETGICDFSVFCPTFSGKIYKYVGSDFALATTAEFIASVESYTNYFTIEHTATETKKKFKKGASGTDGNGDVEAVMFSFQEISQALNLNPGSAELWFENNIRTINGKNKHTLVMTTEKSVTLKFGRAKYVFPEFFDLKNLTLTAAAVYANLAHLCPPNCPTLSYKKPCESLHGTGPKKKRK